MHADDPIVTPLEWVALAVLAGAVVALVSNRDVLALALFFVGLTLGLMQLLADVWKSGR